MKKKNLIVILLGVLLGESLATAQDNTAKPNVIVIIADDLGYADVSCLGNGAVKTPNIDRLAQSGVKFTSYSLPITAAIRRTAARTCRCAITNGRSMKEAFVCRSSPRIRAYSRQGLRLINRLARWISFPQSPVEKKGSNNE